MTGFSGKVAVVGVGRTDGFRTPGKTSLQLHAEVSRKALADAGLGKETVDGVLTAGCDNPTYTEDVAHSAVFCEYMGFKPRFTYSVDLGTPVFVKMVEIAATAIFSGLCRTVLIACAEPTVSAATRRAAVAKMAAFGHPEFELPFGVSIPAFYALIASRHMHEYGTTSHQLGRVAVAMRRHAARNPAARFKEPITVDDVLASRLIAAPLHLLDCCITTRAAEHSW
jgi:acetyl-CoA acetyltransferase